MFIVLKGVLTVSFMFYFYFIVCSVLWHPRRPHRRRVGPHGAAGQRRPPIASYDAHLEVALKDYKGYIYTYIYILLLLYYYIIIIYYMIILLYYYLFLSYSFAMFDIIILLYYIHTM